MLSSSSYLGVGIASSSAEGFSLKNFKVYCQSSSSFFGYYLRATYCLLLSLTGVFALSY